MVKQKEPCQYRIDTLIKVLVPVHLKMWDFHSSGITQKYLFDKILEQKSKPSNNFGFIMILLFSITYCGNQFIKECKC
jgi:hypothetical protein